MKRVKAINGYTIYETTAKDVKDGYEVIGEYVIYFSSDIKDYGREFSYPEFEGCGSLEEAIAWCTGSNYAVAKEVCEAESTCVSAEEIEAVEQELDNGTSIEDAYEAYLSKQEEADRLRFEAEDEEIEENYRSVCNWYAEQGYQY